MVNHRASSRLCWALNFLTFIHDGTSFLRPALRVQNASIWRRAGLVRAWDNSSGVGLDAEMIWSRVETGSYRRGPLKRTRAGSPLMAKKRRRRKLEEVKPDGKATAPSESDVQGNGASGTATPSSNVSDQAQELRAGERGVDAASWEVAEGEDEDSGLGSVVMPPLPSELGAEALRISQELQEEDMLSPAVFQVKPDVADVEMISGRATEVLDLMDEASTAKDSKYSFGLEVELPMESENREAGTTESALTDSPMAPDGVMPLPDLRDLAKKSRTKDRQKEVTQAQAIKVERGNVAAFTKLLELDPEADSEEGLFTTESYDTFSSLLGEGKPFVGIANSYLQSGHTVLLGLLLLCGFVELPGFPLTSLPYDVREFLKTSLLVIYLINTGIAIRSYMEAKRIGQPSSFWAVKGFVLGGLAYNELSQIEPRKEKAVVGDRKRRG